MATRQARGNDEQGRVRFERSPTPLGRRLAPTERGHAPVDARKGGPSSEQFPEGWASRRASNTSWPRS
jgi:hypothetical protein